MKFKLPLKKRLISLFVLIVCSLFYSFESHNPAPIASDQEPPLLYHIPGSANIRDTLIESLLQAQEEIHMVIYALKDQRFIKTLNKKAADGVSIAIIYDSEASDGVEKKLHPKIQLFPKASQGLMHQKILVVDRETIWIGSANYTHDSLLKHYNLIENFKSKEVAAKLLTQIESMKSPIPKKCLNPLLFNFQGQRSALYFLPDKGQALNELTRLIDSAKKTVQVAMYTFTHKGLTDSLISAKKRGVKVEVAIDLSTSKNASRKIVELLKKEKIPLYFNSGQELLHHKFVWIDGKYLAHGSANWTLAAFNQNDDCIMIHYGLTNAQKKVLQEAWRNVAKEKS